MRTSGDINARLTDWAYSSAPRQGTFFDGIDLELGALRPSDVFDELRPSDVFDVGPDDLCPLHELSRAELLMLSDFDGFWSKVTSGVKKVAKVVQEKGVPVLKYGIPGVKDLGGTLKKVGRFVVESPLLQKALETAIPVVGPLVTGPMLEVAASMVEQQGKKRLIESGQAPSVSALVAKVDGKKASPTEASPKRAVLPAAATVGFSPLPAAGIKKVDFAATLAQMQRLAPVGQKVVQRLVRSGIPATTAAEVVASVAPSGELKPTDIVNAAYIGALRLQQERSRNFR